jgi:hypothetical protein
MYETDLFSAGIIVKYGYGGSGNYGWWAKVEFEDLGHCDRGSIKGSITTKYADKLAYSIDTIKADAEKLGIQFYNNPGVMPFLFYLRDGEDVDYPPPSGWKETLRTEANRIGFKTYKGV